MKNIPQKFQVVVTEYVHERAIGLCRNSAPRHVLKQANVGQPVTREEALIWVKLLSGWLNPDKYRAKYDIGYLAVKPEEQSAPLSDLQRAQNALDYGNTEVALEWTIEAVRQLVGTH